MTPIHTILHPTDFSAHSQYAFRLACSLARDLGARLVVAHVNLPPVRYGEMRMLLDDPAEVAQALGERLLRIQAPEPGVPVEHRLIEGDPSHGILEAARECGCDLIVMGTHGRTGVKRLLMGSVAEQVMRKAPCPVLTVRVPAFVGESAADPNPGEPAARVR